MSSPEVVKIKAKKINDLLQIETKKFSVDPKITSLVVLKDLLRRAFNLKCDFVVSYLPTVTECRRDGNKYLPVLSEWDLNRAVVTASEPYLFLKIDSKPFDIDDEWNVVDCEELKSSDQLLRKEPNRELGFLSSVNGFLPKSSWFSNAGVQNGAIKILSAVTSFNETTGPSKLTSPLSDVEFRSLLDGDGRVLNEKLFRLTVYQRGIDDSLRAVVWRHLLNVYPKELHTGAMTGRQRIAYTQQMAEKYHSIKSAWLNRLNLQPLDESLRLTCVAVSKDVLRTDRSHEFYAADGDNNKNVLSLFYQLVTYALTHPDVGYCQGMSDLASLILFVMKDEAQAYVAFCALMKRMKRNFAADGRSMIMKFCHLTELLQFYDPTFFEYLRETNAEHLLFCYRWLLLDLKREFDFNDALTLMDVMWASLPPDIDETPSLYDVDISRVQIKEEFGAQSSRGPDAQETSCHKPNVLSNHQTDADTSSMETKLQRIKSLKLNFSPKSFETFVADACSKEYLSSSKVSPISVAEEAAFSPTACLTLKDLNELFLSRDQFTSSAFMSLPKSTSSCDMDGYKSKLSDVDNGIEQWKRENCLTDGFSNVGQMSKVLLPPPDVFGDGNPFMMFVCLTLLVQHRDVIMQNRLDFNDIAIYFDKMVRKHKVHKVLRRAKRYFADYLKCDWFEQPSTSDS